MLVTARTSAFHFKGQEIPVPEIAAKLGVAHAVEGSVQRNGDQLRVTAQLIRAADGFHLWSKNYDRETADTFGVQTDIAEETSAALGVVLDDEQLAMMRAEGVRDPAAFIALQKGYEAYDKAHEAPDIAKELLDVNRWFDVALEIEPGIAGAYFSRADYYTHFLFDSINNPDGSYAGVDEAYEKLLADLDMAARTASDEAFRLGISLDLAIISGSWGSAPELLSQVANSSGCPTTETVRIAQSGFARRPHVRLAQQMFLGELTAGRPDDAEQVITRFVRGESQEITLREMLAAATGDEALAEEFSSRFDEMGGQRPTGFISGLARRGLRDEANRLAAEVDAHPYGYLGLMLVPVSCLCGAPWDLEHTPNFAKLLEDAELSWPPASPINWPLKDW